MQFCNRLYALILQGGVRKIESNQLLLAPQHLCQALPGLPFPHPVSSVTGHDSALSHDS